MQINLVDMGIVAQAGFTLIPLHRHDAQIPDKKGNLKPAGKRPQHLNWTKQVYNNATVLEGAAKSGWNLGVRLTGHDLVVDIDPRHFPEGETMDTDNPLRRLEAACGFSYADYPHTVTGSGGLHIWMKKDPGLSVRDSLPEYPGVEYKTLGRQVVAPGSIHPDTGKLYVLVQPFLAELDATPMANPELSVLIGHKKVKVNRTESLRRALDGPVEHNRTTLDARQISEVLPFINISAGQGLYPDWIRLLASANFASDGDFAVMEELEAWSDGDANVGDKWQSFGQYSGDPVTFGTFAQLALQYSDPENREAIQQWITDTETASDYADGPDKSGVVRDKPVNNADPHGIDQMAVKDRPQVLLTGSNREEMLEQTALHLYRKLGDSSIFYRGAELVNVTQIGGQMEEVTGAEKIVWTKDQKGRDCYEKYGVRIYPGSTMVMPLNGAMLRYYAGKHIAYSKPNLRAKKRVDGGYPLMAIDAPVDVKDLADLPNIWPFRELMAIVSTPVVDFVTGDVIDKPGLQPGSGVLASFKPDDFQGIKTDLDQAASTERLRWVHHTLYHHFPFEGGEYGPSSAVNIAACFCALLRPVMEKGAPLHAFDAPRASSGKSKLTETHGVLASGAIPSMVSWSNDGAENEKRLGAALRRAPQVLVFDNLEAKIGDALQFPHMNTAVTASKVWLRLLGFSEGVELPCLTLFEASGNNIRVLGDMTSRVVKCRIDAKMARPETRSFNFDPVTRALEMRSEIVVALLSVISSYIKAGRPSDSQVGAMRFGDAWRAVQGVLMWCGWEDPALTVAEVRATDDRAELEADAAEVWTDIFGTKWVSTADLFQLHEDGQRTADDEDATLIFDVIATSVASASALSRGIKAGDVFGDYVVETDQKGQGRLRMKMARLVKQE